MRAVLLLALILPTAAPAETRCGWIVNPSPGNWWLTDAEGDWVLMAQGGEPAPGMELIPDLTADGQWVETNGAYGYGCACADLDTSDGAVMGITAFRQQPLATCEADPNLP